MALNFLSVTICNFMSYGNNTTIFDLQTPGTTLILGEDLDNTASGVGGNGVGKSTIINALTYGMYGKPLSNISMDNLVNNINKKNMKITVTFEKDGKYYHIERVRKAAKTYTAGNYVKFYIGDDLETLICNENEQTRDSISNTNKILEGAIGIPYELFCRIVVFSALHIPFLDLPVRHISQPSQTVFIEELFDLTTLSARAEILKKQIKENETRLEINENKVKQQESEHKRHTTQLKSAETRVVNWEKTNKQQLTELDGKLKIIKDVNIDKERDTHDTVNELTYNINTIEQECNTFKTKIVNLTKEIKKKEQELGHLTDEKCPYCLQKFEGADGKIQEIESAIQQKRDQTAQLEQGCDECTTTVKKLQRKLKSAEKKITITNIDELIQISSESKHIKERISELASAVNPFIEPLEELEKVKLAKINKKETNTLVNLIEHERFLYKLLTKKDSFVRKALLHKNIPFLNSKLRYYLTELGLSHTVEFTHELTAKISQFGRTLDFGNLSNGQRARVNLALSLTFRQVLLNLHTNINVILFDEVLDVGLDGVGVQAAAKLLKKITRNEGTSCFIISHRDEIESAFDNKLMVQLVNGFSNIEKII